MSEQTDDEMITRLDKAGEVKVGEPIALGGLVWGTTPPDSAGWWWVRDLNAHPPTQVVSVQKVCGVWAALLWGQWREVANLSRFEWAGPVPEPAAPTCSPNACVGSGDCVNCCPDCDALRSDGYDDGPCERHSKKSRLLKKVQLIMEGRSAILPSGVIVEAGTPGSMNYTGHVPCQKCGQVHWMYGPCPPKDEDPIISEQKAFRNWVLTHTAAAAAQVIKDTIVKEARLQGITGLKLRGTRCESFRVSDNSQRVDVTPIRELQALYSVMIEAEGLWADWSEEDGWHDAT